jgi:hypothetical protein
MVDGVTYSNVTFTAVTPTTVSIIHQTGAATIPLDKLSLESQKQFNYDPKRAAEYQLTLAPRPSEPPMPDGNISAHLSTFWEGASNRPDAFGVAGSPFATYDKKIIATVQKRWYALIERFGMYERAGKVTVHFQILNNGNLENLKVSKNTAV